MKYQSQSHTRVDLAGGTLDLWPLSALVPEALTLNMSINCFTSVEFSPLDHLRIHVESPDFNLRFDFDSLEEFFKSEAPQLTLLQKVFLLFDNSNQGVGHWVLKSESPAGSGLGGSSSLLISLLKVAFQVKQQPLPYEEQLVEMAKNLETQVLKAPAGIQDYYSPIKPGLNALHFDLKGCRRESLDSVFDFWKPHFALVDSKIKHHSGLNNWDILKSYIEGNPQTIAAVHDLVKVAHKVKEALVTKNIEGLCSAFAEELLARKKVSRSYIPQELQQFLNELEQTPGLLGYKVCGAGGGGCVLLCHQNPKELLAAYSGKYAFLSI